MLPVAEIFIPLTVATFAIDAALAGWGNSSPAATHTLAAFVAIVLYFGSIIASVVAGLGVNAFVARQSKWFGIGSGLATFFAVGLASFLIFDQLPIVSDYIRQISASRDF